MFLIDEPLNGIKKREEWPDVRRRSIVGHSRQVNSVSFSQVNGDHLASGSDDSTARIWDVETSRLVARMECEESVVQLAYSPIDDTRVATLTGDRSVRIWDTRHPRKAVSHIKLNREYINVAWHPGGDFLAVGSSVGGDKDTAGGVKDCLSIIDLQKSTVLKRLRFKYEVNEFLFASLDNDPNNLLLTTEHGTIEVLSVDCTTTGSDTTSATTKKEPYTMHGHTDDCFCISKSNHLLAVGAKDALASIWDLRTMVAIKYITSHTTPVRSVALSHDAAFIATAAYEPGVDISYTSTADRAFFLDTNTTSIHSLAWHPKRYILALAGEPKQQQSSNDHHDAHAVQLISPPASVLPKTDPNYVPTEHERMVALYDDDSLLLSSYSYRS